MVHLARRWMVSPTWASPLLCVLTVGIIHAAEPILRLPKDRDSCFCCRAFTNTNYLVFRKEGRYVHVSRAHVGIIICDQGEWKQNNLGTVELRSGMRVKSVQCGPLAIRVERVEVLRTLTPLKADIASFLARSRGDSFSREEIERAWQYRFQLIADSPEVSFPFPAVTVAPGVKSITRRDVENLLEAWDKYLADGNKNLLHATPVVFQRRAFLVSNDDPLLLCASLDDVKKSLDTWAGEGTCPYFIYVMIPYEQYLDEIKSLQPFLFRDRRPEDHKGTQEEADGDVTALGREP